MRLRIAASVLVGLSLAAVPALPVAAQTGLCSRFGSVAPAGAVTDPDLDETSGLAASRRHPGILWAHNDSGGEPEVHALGADGALLGTYGIEGAEARDWEDMAIGPGTDAGHPALYLGDIGDNDAERPFVTVYRAAEPDEAPDGAGGRLALLDATEVRYPDGPADAEGLFVDPASGDVLILTKAYFGPSQVLRVPSESLGADEVVEAEVVTELVVPAELALGEGLPGTAVTSADVAPDGSFVLVRTYQAVLAYAVAPGGSLVDALSETPCAGPAPREAQGESIAISAAGDAYLTTSEGTDQPLQRASIAPTSGDDTDEATDIPPDVQTPASDDPPAAVLTGIGGIGLLAVAAIAVWWWRSRRADDALPPQGEDSGRPAP